MEFKKELITLFEEQLKKDLFEALLANREYRVAQSLDLRMSKSDGANAWFVKTKQMKELAEARVRFTRETLDDLKGDRIIIA